MKLEKSFLLRWERLLLNLKFKWWTQLGGGIYSQGTSFHHQKTPLKVLTTSPPSLRAAFQGHLFPGSPFKWRLQSLSHATPNTGTEDSTLLCPTATSRPLLLDPHIKSLLLCFSCYSATHSSTSTSSLSAVTTCTSSTLSEDLLAIHPHCHYLLCHYSWIISILYPTA